MEINQHQKHLSRLLIIIMATATGLSVANNYYAQPLLPFIAQTLHLSQATAGWIVTVAQMGYAGGLVFLLPLGDLLERRRLVVLLASGTTLSLIWFSFSSSIFLLMPAAFFVGGFSMLAQILVPFTADLADQKTRGQAVGMVMSGLLLGVLLARTVAGYIAQFAGTWRAVYEFAAGVMFILTLVLWRTLPTYKKNTKVQAYGNLLTSVLTLFREEPLLRLRSLFGALGFGAFSVLWTSISFLLAGPPYHYSVQIIGLFGLVGAAGALTATIAGKLSDNGKSNTSTLITSLLLALSWIPIFLGQDTLVSLIIGIILLDIATQGLHITNQSIIYTLNPHARSRITSAYMTSYFIGGAVGSGLSALAYDTFHWTGVVIIGALFGVTAVVMWTISTLLHTHFSIGTRIAAK